MSSNLYETWNASFPCKVITFGVEILNCWPLGLGQSWHGLISSLNLLYIETAPKHLKTVLKPLDDYCNKFVLMRGSFPWILTKFWSNVYLVKPGPKIGCFRSNFEIWHSVQHYISTLFLGGWGVKLFSS